MGPFECVKKRRLDGEGDRRFIAGCESRNAWGCCLACMLSTRAARRNSSLGHSAPPRKEVAKLRAREINGRNWAGQYHNRGPRGGRRDSFRDSLATKASGHVRCQGLAQAESDGNLELDHCRSFSANKLFERPRKNLRIRAKRFAASDL